MGLKLSRGLDVAASVAAKIQWYMMRTGHSNGSGKREYPCHCFELGKAWLGFHVADEWKSELQVYEGDAMILKALRRRHQG